MLAASEALALLGIKKTQKLQLKSKILSMIELESGDAFMPCGNTEIELYDHLVCLVDTKSIPELEKIIQCKKNGSDGRS